MPMAGPASLPRWMRWIHTIRFSSVDPVAQRRIPSCSLHCEACTLHCATRKPASNTLSEPPAAAARRRPPPQIRPRFCHSRTSPRGRHCIQTYASMQHARPRVPGICCQSRAPCSATPLTPPPPLPPRSPASSQPHSTGLSMHDSAHSSSTTLLHCNTAAHCLITPRRLGRANGQGYSSVR